jgi:hypothetical protein
MDAGVVQARDREHCHVPWHVGVIPRHVHELVAVRREPGGRIEEF